MSCPELDEHDDSDSTSFTLANSDKNSFKARNNTLKISDQLNKNNFELNELNDYENLKKLNSLENIGLETESTANNKRKSILKNKVSDFKDDYDGVVALELKRKPNSRLSLKFEEEKKPIYPFDTSSFTPCGLQRKKTEEMKIDSQIFSKYKKNISYSGTKAEISSPDLDNKKRKTNPSKLSFNVAIDEEDEFSLYPCKYQSCNLEGFDPKFGVRKGSSILSKLRLGVSRKHTTPLFPVAKGSIDEEEDDELDCKK